MLDTWKLAAEWRYYSPYCTSLSTGCWNKLAIEWQFKFPMKIKLQSIEDIRDVEDGVKY